MDTMTKRAKAEDVADALEQSGFAMAIDAEGARLLVRLLRRLSLGRAVSVDEARDLAADVPDGGALVDAALTLSERDAAGAIVGLLGLSLNDHPHNIQVGDRQLAAWCAWDTLFLPPILGESAVVTSRDPAGGQTIRVSVSPNGIESAEPDGLLLSVVTPDLRSCADAASVQAMFCQFVHFFSDAGAAEGWFRDRDMSAYLLTLDEGFELGRIRLADLHAQAAG